MNDVEIVWCLVLVGAVFCVLGFCVSQLISPSFESGYQQGWNDYKTQIEPFLEKAKSIVNECADKAIIVIDERDACNIELAVCKNELYYYKGVN